MSNRERVLQLIDDIPDDKLIFVVNILEDLRAYAGEAIPPDEWDLKMIAEEKAEIARGEFVRHEDINWD